MMALDAREAHILAVPACSTAGTPAAAREAFEARVLYLLDQGVWPIATPEGPVPDMAPGDGVLFAIVGGEAAELVGSARVDSAPAPLSDEQLAEARVYLQAQDPSAEIPASAFGVRLSEMDVWAKAIDASSVLTQAGVSASETARRGAITIGAEVFAAAVAKPPVVIEPPAIGEPASLIAPAAEPISTGSGLLEFVRRHWKTLEFDRPLALVGGEGEAARIRVPPDLGKALICHDRDSGHLVVLTVAEAGADVGVVGQTLRHIGWLQEHAAIGGQHATGLIVAEEPTDDLMYAASAASNVELASLHLRLASLSEAPVDAVSAEHRFWRTIEKLSAWCAVHSLEATLTARELDFDPVAENSPVWGYVTALARAVDHRCPWTAGHSMRVADLLVAMAGQLRLGGDVRQYLRMGGLLHDVGNMGVSTTLFDKRTRLSPEEFSEFRRHPELGAQIVREVNLLSPITAGIHHHHERLDGRGYPSGLGGEQIPLMARMIGVACCWDAMTSRRPYREAIRPETALDIMHAEAGQHWDASIVDALARIVNG